MISNLMVVSNEEASFRQVILDHYLRYPLMQVLDLYKLIHQGVFGCEHAYVDEENARLMLEQEMKNKSGYMEEPVIDPISVDGQIVRVNLRPYFAGGGNLLSLTEAFILTARKYKGIDSTFIRYWGYAEKMVVMGDLIFNIDDMRKEFTILKQAGFPPVHHTEQYVKAYQPAYRVVLREYLMDR